MFWYIFVYNSKTKPRSYFSFLDCTVHLGQLSLPWNLLPTLPHIWTLSYTHTWSQNVHLLAVIQCPHMYTRSPHIHWLILLPHVLFPHMCTLPYALNSTVTNTHRYTAISNTTTTTTTTNTTTTSPRIYSVMCLSSRLSIITSSSLLFSSQ